MATKSPIYKYQPIWGTWRVDELMSQGNYGETYKVYKEEWGRLYVSAVKLISIAISDADIREAEAIGIDADSMPDYFKGHVNGIINEIEVMYRLRGNSNIVTYEDHVIFQKKGKPSWDILIRMEYLKSLPDYMSEHKLNRDEVVKLGVDICKALEACEKEGIIHRDIKDANIFVSDKGDFKLGNFSIARELSKFSRTAPPQSNDLFMAPEAFKEHGFDSSADIYSLGMLMYKLLNKGRLPFLPLPPEPISLADTEYSMRCRLSGKEIPLPVEADEKLGKIILKACSFNQKDRYKSPSELRQRLERMLKLDSRVDKTEKYIYAKEDNESIPATMEKQEKHEERKAEAAAPEYTAASDKPARNAKPYLAEKQYAVITVAVVAVLVAGVGLALLFSPPKAAREDIESKAATAKTAQVPAPPTVIAQITPRPTEAPKELAPGKTASEYYDAGMDYMKEKQYTMAFKAFDRAKQMGYDRKKIDRQISSAKRFLDIQKLYEAAMKNYEKHDYINALDSFRQLVSLDGEYKSLPQYSDTYFQLAYTHNLSGVKYFNEGKLQAAISEFDAALGKLSEMETSAIKYNTGLCESWIGIYNENKNSAEKKLEKIKENLKLAEQCNKSGVKLFNGNDKSGARQEFEKAVGYMEEIKALIPSYSFEVYEGTMQIYADNLRRTEKAGK